MLSIPLNFSHLKNNSIFFAFLLQFIQRVVVGLFRH